MRTCEVRKKYFRDFMKALIRAGKNMVDSHHFQLPVADEENEKKIFRERVYCYELYHQLRLALGDIFPYKIHGEVDKSGHPIIRSKKKPDFIIHDPGNMDNNLVVIEVKHIRSGMKDLKCDLKTLQLFLNMKYHRTILLVYGNNREDIPEKIRSEVIDVSKNCGNRILLMWHAGRGQKPKVLYGD